MRGRKEAREGGNRKKKEGGGEGAGRESGMRLKRNGSI